jgi:hypothetical protein
MTPQPDPELARVAEDLVAAGARVLERSAQRRDDVPALAAIQRAQTWLFEHIVRELRPRG